MLPAVNEIAWLEVADPPELWASLGFGLSSDGVCVIGGVEHRLVGPDPERRGVVGWALRGDAAAHLDAIEATEAVDGLPTRVAVGYGTPPTPTHPNGVTRIDHLVVRTPSTPRTTAVLEAVGFERRGHRTTNSAGDQVDMTFFWVGDVILELSGPPAPTTEAGSEVAPARFAGIAYACADLDRTVAHLGERCTPPRDAGQPGRRIAALRAPVGSTMPMAFMSPHRGRAPG